MKHVLKKTVLFVCCVVFLSIPALYFWPLSHKPSPLLQASAKTADAQRGRYLLQIGGCIACHTDTRKNGAPFAGGAALKTPFGTFNVPNITSDVQNGIGGWSLETFDAALRSGVSPSGEPYYPVFPYLFYSKLNDQDVVDMWAALKDVPPQTNASADHALTFPFSLRFGLKLWRAVYFDASPFKAEQDRTPAYTKGAYLAETIAHCGACHTPRDFLGGRNTSQKYKGASNLPGGGKSSDISAKALLKKGWSASDLSFYLETGITPDGDVAGGLMGEVISEGTAFLKQDDMEALLLYLLTEP